MRAMFLPGTEVGLAEAYLYNDFDIEGENVYQALLIKPDKFGHSGVPLTRADWYLENENIRAE
jgi:hypothetical protein